MSVMEIVKALVDPRPVTQTARILKILEQRGRISNYELWNMHIQRGSERIRELKSEGHQIVGVRDKGSLYWYVYKGHDEAA